MKVFICKSHDGVWLHGCSVVIAKDVEAAQELLDRELAEHQLKTRAEHPYELQEIPSDNPNVFMLFDGDY